MTLSSDALELPLPGLRATRRPLQMQVLEPETQGLRVAVFGEGR